MAYDVELADRIRELLADEPDLSERKMFGGLAFLIGGHMTVVASGQGGLMARTDPEGAAALVATGPAETVVMQGREMRGWLRLASSDVATDDDLESWVERALDYTSTLPPKA